MPSLGIRLRAVASVALGVVAGALTNIVTSDFSWVLIAALVTVVAVWMVLVWIDSSAAGPSDAGPARSRSITMVASEGGSVAENVVEANLASMEMKATRGGIVEGNHVLTDGTDVHLESSDRAGIKDNRLIATMRRGWRDRNRNR
ncbi:hypothetical protein [Streptomyces sp. NPDC048349]|uniref:hypothetical protein n=1 Tax=Streptomyces sp. NPDC048349 TaxID=3155486 RepID=UPI00343AA24A